jgi:hypothetical protein
MLRKITIAIVITFLSFAPAWASEIDGGGFGLDTSGGGDSISSSSSGSTPTSLTAESGSTWEELGGVVGMAESAVNTATCAVTTVLFGDCSSGSTSALNGLGGTTLDGGGAAIGLQVFESNYRGNTYGSAIGMLTGWTNFVLPFVSVIAIVALIYAGFLYLTSFGNEEQSGKAKKIIMWVVLGIILIVSAYAIVNTLVETDNSASTDDDFSLNVNVGGVGVDIQ